MIVQFEPVTGPERDAVVKTFMQTLNKDTVRVEKVERVQNLSAWQSYAVKKATMLNRDGADKGARLEKTQRWTRPPPHFSCPSVLATWPAWKVAAARTTST